MTVSSQRKRRSPKEMAGESRRSRSKVLVLAASLLVALGTSAAQEMIDPSMTLKGIDTVRVTPGSIMREAIQAGLTPDSLEYLVAEMLRAKGLEVREDASAVLRFDVQGFLFASRISFSIKVSLWQPAVLVSSGQTMVVQTWTQRIDGEAEKSVFVEECNRAARGSVETFLADYVRANEGTRK